MKDALDGLTVVTRNGMRRMMVALLCLLGVSLLSVVIGAVSCVLSYRQTLVVEGLVREPAPTGCEPCSSSTMAARSGAVPADRGGPP